MYREKFEITLLNAHAFQIKMIKHWKNYNHFLYFSGESQNPNQIPQIAKVKCKSRLNFPTEKRKQLLLIIERRAESNQIGWNRIELD